MDRDITLGGIMFAVFTYALFIAALYAVAITVATVVVFFQRWKERKPPGER